jgi:hypothetical protein
MKMLDISVIIVFWSDISAIINVYKNEPLFIHCKATFFKEIRKHTM